MNYSPTDLERQTIDATGKDGKHAGYLVWSAYVLQKTGPNVEGVFAGLECKPESPF
jgi:hypothetical protein